MSKQEFLNGLYSILNGQIPANQVEENIRYYRDYIDSQIRSGKSEAEVLRALGDPRLIARTIVETSGPAAANAADENYRSNGYESSDTSAKDSFESKKTFRMPGWLMAILLFLVLLFLLSLVISVLSFLAPLIIVMAMVIFLVKLFRDWLN